jgi:hypothetical protein
MPIYTIGVHEISKPVPISNGNSIASTGFANCIAIACHNAVHMHLAHLHTQYAHDIPTMIRVKLYLLKHAKPDPLSFRLGLGAMYAEDLNRKECRMLKEAYVAAEYIFGRSLGIGSVATCTYDQALTLTMGNIAPGMNMPHTMHGLPNTFLDQ